MSLLSGDSLAAAVRLKHCHQTADHAWGPWHTGVPPENVALNAQIRKCANCDLVETHPSSRAGYNPSVEFVPTESNKCIPFFHTWSNWYVGVPPGGISLTAQLRRCQKCGLIKARKLPT